MELFLVLGTWALVAVTFWMAHKQIALLKQQTEDNRVNLRLQSHLSLTSRFDSRELQSDRKLLAQRLPSKVPHDEIPETVMDFFEDMGLFLRRGYLDEELLWNTFGFYAVRWWAACKNYVLEERKRQSDTTLFTDFEDLANRFRMLDVKSALAEASNSEVDAFLRDESNI